MACSSLLVAAARSPMLALSTAGAGWASKLSMRSSQPISAKNARALMDQLGQSSSMPLNSGSSM
eukprot:877659-Pyramimonas_sp.AAC.1